MTQDAVANALTDQEYETMMSQLDSAQDWMVEQLASKPPASICVGQGPTSLDTSSSEQ